MHRIGFTYRTSTTIELNGFELALLRVLAVRHYDATCRRAFQLGGFGYGWCTRFEAEDESLANLDLDHMTDAVAMRTIEVEASNRELDLICKCMEMPLPEPYAKWQGGATSLRDAFVRELHAVHDENRRLNHW